MRKSYLFVILILLSGVTGAYAQEQEGQGQQGQRQGQQGQGLPQPSAQPAANLNSTEQQHPKWFRETYTYRPCPAEVEFPNGRHACLGVPR